MAALSEFTHTHTHEITCNGATILVTKTRPGYAIDDSGKEWSLSIALGQKDYRIRKLDGGEFSAVAPTTATVVDRAVREVAGTVSKIIWTDPDNNAIILALDSDTVCVGECEPGEIERGGEFRFFGQWTEHARHGDRFQFSTFAATATTTNRVSVARYLTRAFNMTQSQVNALWAKYGTETLDVLRRNPDRVAADNLLAPDIAKRISSGMARNADTEAARIGLFELFAGKGFPRSTVNWCVRKYGATAPAKVRRNPFRLLVDDAPGVGFRRADRLWIDLGYAPHKLRRQMFAGLQALKDASEGHTWQIRGAFAGGVLKAVGANKARVPLAIRMATRLKLLSTRVDGSGEWIGERAKTTNEACVASCVHALSTAAPVLWPAITDESLSQHQRDAIATILTSPVAILGGTPGTGKTYTAAAILKAVVHQYGVDAIGVAAPTGKAAVRITEALQRYGLGKLEAKTIHRMLGVAGHDKNGFKFKYNWSNRLPYQFVVIDETSMLDTDLAAALFVAMKHGTHVLLIGDPYQLPPVGHGAPLRDLIAAGVPTAILSEIQRNSGLIVKACAQIKDGKRFDTSTTYDPDAGLNLRFVECVTPEIQCEMLQRILESVKSFDPVWDAQVLCCRNQGSEVARTELNVMLQTLLNSKAAAYPHGFRQGDKVICLKNSFSKAAAIVGEDADPHDVDAYKAQGANGHATEVFLANGDMGRVIACDAIAMVVKFSAPERIVKIPLKTAKKSDAAEAASENGEQAGVTDFALAYAITCHKSQGSEWPMVIYLVDDAGGRVASREHIYTGISRASKLAWLLGKRATCDKQCRKVSLEKRKTFLVELVRELNGANGGSK